MTRAVEWREEMVQTYYSPHGLKSGGHELRYRGQASLDGGDKHWAEILVLPDRWTDGDRWEWQVNTFIEGHVVVGDSGSEDTLEEAMHAAERRVSAYRIGGDDLAWWDHTLGLAGR